MIVVTGGLGFIGQNLVKELMKQGYEDIIILDTKCKTLNQIQSWLVKHVKEIEGIYHLGAITDTTETNWSLLEYYNIFATKFIWDVCTGFNIPLVYASSAAIYGDGSHGFNEIFRDFYKVKPLNLYGKSKLNFDYYTDYQSFRPPFWAGLRFFNVYGYGEAEKGKMASVVYHAYNQINKTGELKLFKSHHDDYKDGEQLRDFIYVDDIVSVCINLMEKKPESGIYNVGTGKAETFNNVAKAVIDWHKEGGIEYIPFPEHLKGAYQSYTQADISGLKQAGYIKDFLTVKQGVTKYLDWLNLGVR